MLQAEDMVNEIIAPELVVLDVRQQANIDHATAEHQIYCRWINKLIVQAIEDVSLRPEGMAAIACVAKIGSWIRW